MSFAIRPNNSRFFRFCAGCGKEFPLNSDYFYQSPKKTFGYHYNCKTCFKKKSNIIWHKNKPLRGRFA